MKKIDHIHSTDDDTNSTITSKDTYRHVLMGDSVVEDTTIILDGGRELAIKDLFIGKPITNEHGKQYCTPTARVLTYNPDTGRNEYQSVKYVMRHYTDKPIYRVWKNKSHWLDVTEDHSLMGYVSRKHRKTNDSAIIKIAPHDLDQCVRCLIMAKRIPLTNDTLSSVQTNVAVLGPDVSLWKPILIEKLPPTTQYVYDIEVESTHTFYANHILVHNTDSSYVRLDLYAERVGLTPTNDSITALADNLQIRLLNDLPDILGAKFVTDPQNLKILVPGREAVGRKALFKLKKKRYAIHIINNKKKIVDKLKVMGMETRRSDTPEFIQDFLTECLTAVVQHDVTYDGVRALVDKFRKSFRQMDPWRLGRPGRVNNLSPATKDYDEWLEYPGEKIPRMHITVSAALNTNRLMAHYGENRWDQIRDGDKVEVLYLKDNPEQMKAVAIRTGELYIPHWFQELPFDVVTMEEKLLDQKLFNVLGDVLGWEFHPPKTNIAEISKPMDDFYD